MVAEARVYEPLRDRLVAAGGHLCTAWEKAALQRTMWPDGGAVPTAEVVAKPAGRLAGLAGFRIPTGATCWLRRTE